MVGKKTTVTVGVGTNVDSVKIPRRHRRSLEIAGSYDVPVDTLPVDNTTVIRPDTVDREVPNLIISPSTNPNYGLFTTGIGYNMYGDLVDYNNNRFVTEKEAKQKARDYANKKKANRYKDSFDKYLRNKK